MKMYIRAVCEYSIRSGSSATVAASARFQLGRRKRRPARNVRAMTATPHRAEGRRNAHSDSPKICTDAAMR